MNIHKGQNPDHPGRIPLVAGLAASILSVACCAGPLILVSVGLGGAWASRLAALDPYRPWFIALSLLFLGWGIWSAYRRRSFRSCGVGTLCSKPANRTNDLMWALLILSLGILSFPWYGAWIFR
jgi:mercuric ion transport protein